MAIKGITYDNQGPTAASHGDFFSTTHSDGILSGCALTFSGNTVHIAAGRIVTAGRLCELESATEIRMSNTTGVSRIVLQTDLSREATVTSFEQLSFIVQNAASVSALPALITEDINQGRGLIYQAEICVVGFANSQISSFLRRIGRSAPVIRDGSVTPSALSLRTKSLFYRPNLLDNWYFFNPVNQRGVTSVPGYEAGEPYFIDRWRRAGYAAATLTVGGGVTFDNSAVTAGGSGIAQILPNVLPSGTYTLTVYLTECTGSFWMGVNDSSSTIIKGEIFTSPGLHSMTVTSDSIKQVRLLARAESVCRISAVKLERGTAQTLAHINESGIWEQTEIPDFGLEFEKCRRYFQRIQAHRNYTEPIAYGYMTATTAGRVVIPLPTPLRTIPTLVATDVNFAVKGEGRNVNLTETPTVFLSLGHMLYLAFTTPEAFSENALAMLCCSGSDAESTSYIDLSAEL